MYRYDKERKILFPSKLPIDTEFHGYKVSDHYRAYKDYLYDEPKSETDICLRNDFKMLGSALAEAYNKRKSANMAPVKFNITDIIEEDFNTKVRNTDYAFTTVMGSIEFGYYKSPVFPMLRLPCVDRFGMINYKKHLYTISATSEPSKYITYDDDNDVMNIMLNAKNVKIYNDPSKMKVKFGSNKKINLTTLLYGVSYLHNLMSDGAINFAAEGLNYIEDGYTMIRPDPNAMLAKILTPDNIKWRFENANKLDLMAVETDDPQNWNQILNYPAVLMGMFGLANISKNGIDPDALYSVRDQLNELVNIDRGLGRILSRDVVLDDGEIVGFKGQVVNKELINILNKENINEYYVTYLDVLDQEAKLAVDIAIKSIPPDILIPDDFREQNEFNLDGVPDLTDKLYEFQPNLYPVLRKGTQLTAIVMQLIQASELTQEVQIRISGDDEKLTRTIPDFGATRYYNNTMLPVLKAEDESSVFKLSNVVYITLEEEILGNRHFSKGNSVKFVTEDGLELPPAPHLTVYDIAALMSILPRLSDRYVDRIADRDIGMRKNICLIDEHFHKAMKNSCEKFANMSYRILRDTVEGTKTGIASSESGSLENMMIRMFNFMWHQLGGNRLKVIQQADVTNPVSLVSYANRINTVTKSKHGVSDTMRFLAMGFYGRICPYETPASAKLGLTNTKACHAIIEKGVIYTEYYKVMHIGGKHKVITNKKYKMSVNEEEQYIIADLCSLDLDEEFNILNTNAMLFARTPTVGDIEKMEVQNVSVGAVEFVNCYPDQTVSPTATIMPYINSNDSSRVTYGLNMARQSRPIVNRIVPTIITKGFFDILRANTVFQINAEDNGYVEDVSYSERDGLSTDTIVTIVVRYDHCVKYRHKNEKPSANPENDLYMVYKFSLIEYSYKSVIERKVEVKAGSHVSKGDVIMSSNYTRDGLYAPGSEALIGVAPRGYNYEDGQQQADSLARELTSYGHSDDTFTVRSDTYPASMRSLGYVSSNATRIIKWNGEHVIDDYATSEKLKGFVVNRKLVDKENRAQKQTKTKNYRVDAIYVNAIDEGDKSCNRHGNKGVVSKRLRNSEMLYLPNGEFLDLFYNPSGFASRMNLGQIKELHIGLAGKVLGIKVCVQSFNDLSWEESVILLHYAHDCANLGVDIANSNSKYDIYPDDFKEDVKANEKFIKHWKGVFDKDGCAYVINPKTGKPLRTKIVIGVNAVTKLIQEVDDKEHTRGGFVSGSRYEKKGGRPTRGARRGGGQAIGDMEFRGLMAYGVPNYIYEIMHERGDNPYRRQLINMELLGTDKLMREKDLEILEKTQQRRSVEDFLNLYRALGTRVEIIDPEKGITDPDDPINKQKFLYTTGAVLGEIKPFYDRNVEAYDQDYKKSNEEAFDDEYDE